MRDFGAHNAGVRRLWDGYRRGRPERVPVTFSCNSRLVLLDPSLNPAGISPRRFFEDPDAMWTIELAFHKWLRYEVPQDAEMGPPAEWPMAVNFFNSYEAGWFGCELFYPEHDIPDTVPVFNTEATKRAFYDTPWPDPLRGGLMGRALEFYETFEARRKREDFEGIPVGRPWVPTGSDGPLTVACNLRGAAEFMEDLAEDERYAHDLLAWVTEGIARRRRAWQALVGEGKPKAGEWTWFADDAIAMLSPARYREHVLPFHRKLVDEFRGDAHLLMHLCGNAQHQFPGLVAALGVESFEVGFPTDLARARRELGPDVELIGNVHPNLLQGGPPSAIAEAVRLACQSGVREGKRFVLREGNNVAPLTPVGHFAAMYEAGRRWGAYA